MRARASGVSAILLAALALAAAPVGAQTVYKLIGRDGKVTYAEEPPKYFDGKVIRIDIDPNANKATLGGGPGRGGEALGAEARQAQRRPDAPAPKAAARAQRLESARVRLKAAREALAQAREHPREDEVRFVGNVGGGVRRVPTEEYQQRLGALERAVKEAEDAVQALEKGD